MIKYSLGLDLGTNSIGWAVLNHNKSRHPVEITSCGVRIFQEAVDAKTRTPKNQARREARSVRKLFARRKMRKNKIQSLLINSGFLPSHKDERTKILTDNKSFDPYKTRKDALDRKLHPYELGRVIYHLSQRRGFQSNRKVTSAEEGKVKSAITSLRKEIMDSGARTLGEFLLNQTKKRERYTDREMYKEEFEYIWHAQQKYHPDLMATQLKIFLHNAIFHQRPLKLQKNLIGKCTFEPARKRAAKALLDVQRIRLLQDVNNLEVKNPFTREFRPLTRNEREKIVKLLEKQKTVSWNKVRRVLSLHEGELFNLEEGKKKELIGNRTAFNLRSILGDRWEIMAKREQDSLITDMLTIDSPTGFLNRMKTFWRFSDEESEKLAKMELEPGYARLSLKAARNILPYLEEGKTYDKACLAAGYDHSKPANMTAMDALGEPPYLRNPVVQKALYETRKIINAVIKKIGRPEIIRVEMARDMKLTKKQRDEFQKRQKAREKENDFAREILCNEFGIQNPSRADIQKYQMWQEGGMVCPYTGTAISKQMLFSQEVDVEHILPYSRTLDDSFMNKTLCLAKENRSIKHNKTPYEAYHADQKRYHEMLQRVKRLPFPKRRRFELREIDTEKFIERQLNDTRYICREVKKYLQWTGASVEVSKGEATAALRHRWGLNRILSPDGFEFKNRDDHRHHAIDAVVIALTSRNLFQELSRLSAASGVSLSMRGFHLDYPWPSFFNDLQNKIENLLISHVPIKKITGALHEETAYGWSEHDGCFAYRKPLSSLSSGDVEKIRDKKIRELVMERVALLENNIKKAFGDMSNPLLHVDGKTPIRSVRLAVNFNSSTLYGVSNRTGAPYKFFKFGNNHHVEIIENITTGKRKGVFVTALEAAKRARRENTPIVQRDHGPEWRFLMSLCINDSVEIEVDGNKLYYRVQVLDGSNEKIMLRLNTAATLDDIGTRLIKTPNTLRCRKIQVDPLGRKIPSND